MASATPAIEKLQKKLEKDPNSLIFFQLAEEYRKEGMLPEALRTCRDGLKRHPYYWSARVTFARIQHQLGQRDEALEELETVIKAVPENLLANRLLADIYVETNRAEEALKRYRIIRMMNPADREVTGIINALEGKNTKTEDPTLVEHHGANAGARLSQQKHDEPEPADLPSFDLTPASPLTPEEAADSNGEYAEDAPTVSLPQQASIASPSEESFDADVDSEQSETDIAEIARLLLAPEEGMEPDEDLDGGDDLLSIDNENRVGEIELSAQIEDLESDSFDEREPGVFRAVDQTQPLADTDAGDDEDAEELTTQTLAELYVQQGLIDKAIKVYQRLLLNDPGNSEIMNRLKDLNSVDAMLAGPSQDVEEQQEKKTAPPVIPDPNELYTPSDPRLVAIDQKRRKITTLENWLAAIRRERS